jgi:hypothetical protein
LAIGYWLLHWIIELLRYWSRLPFDWPGDAERALPRSIANPSITNAIANNK